MSQKLFRFLAGAVPVLIICGAPLTYMAAADDPAKPAHIAEAPLPPPATYQIDPVHSFVYFSAWHHIVGTVRGRFDKVTGTITAAPNPAACAVDVTIATYSISTQNSMRDDDLRGPAFFDVTQFPTMNYSGHGIRRLSGGAWIMDGSLTIRGITKVAPMTFTFKGLFPDTPSGQPARGLPRHSDNEARRFWDDPRQSRGTRCPPGARLRCRDRNRHRSECKLPKTINRGRPVADAFSCAP